MPSDKPESEYTVLDRFFDTAEIILEKSQNPYEKGMAHDLLEVPEDKRETILVSLVEFITHLSVGCPPFFNMLVVNVQSSRAGMTVEDFEKLVYSQNLNKN